MIGFKLALSDKQIYIILLVLLVVITAIGVIAQTYAGSGPEFTEGQSLQTARNVVLNSLTYIFDGYELVHKQTNTGKCQDCWVFVFEFRSSHAGYGDRTGQFLAQVITPHTAKITVEQGDVKSAVLDEKWDMRNQQYVESKGPAPTPPAEPEPKEFTVDESLEIVRQFVLDSETYKFDGSGIEHNETLVLRCPSCWQFVFNFESSHSGYGNRTGQGLAQVITPHTATITVMEGNVTHGVLDEKWDMISQKFIPGMEPEEPEPPKPAEDFCGWSTNASCNLDAGCKTGGCSNQVCISLSQWSMTTTCEWRDCYNASAYGLGCKCVDNRCQWSE